MAFGYGAGINAALLERANKVMRTDKMFYELVFIYVKGVIEELDSRGAKQEANWLKSAARKILNERLKHSNDHAVQQAVLNW